ncbi:preprotein translocase subunit SecG [Gammaproteobacteria bacterium]|nr:preprotein translocase subunit SecG [Gammaproteobacteria bacterium]
MYQFILIVHVLAAASVVGLVLLQQGKGASMGAAFGAGASQTVFGSRGSGSFLLKLTIGLAILFFSTSIALNNMAAKADRKSSFDLPAQSKLPVTTAPKSLPVQSGAPLVAPNSIPSG